MGLFVVVGSVQAELVQQQTITQSGGAAGDLFGYTVALSSDGDTAVVGAYADDVGSNGNQGSATVFTRSGSVWTQQQIITQSGGAAGDFFGYSVALSSDGDTAIVGAYSDDVGGFTNQGSATVFTRTGTAWTQQQTVTQSDGSADDFSGHTVALSSDGNTAIVGTYSDDVSGRAAQGSATIFTRTGTAWTQQQTITQSDGAAGDYFGTSVALSSNGNTAIVGTYSDDVSGRAGQGSATIFTRTGTAWTQQQTITQSDGAAGDHFGESVSLAADGNTAVIGAALDSVGGRSGQGSATIFTRTGSVWTQQETITQSDGAAGDYFGISVSISADGNTAFVGAIYDSLSGSATTFVGTVPGASDGVSATSGANAQSVVSWTAPLDAGGATTLLYTVRSQNGGHTCSVSGVLSCTVVGLTNAAKYTFTVTATNRTGAGATSSPSAEVTPGFALTISTFSGSGTITNSTGNMSCTSVCTANQADSTTITATPDPGWVFSSWGGACQGATRICSLLMNQARDVTVFFVDAPPNPPAAASTSTSATTLRTKPVTPTSVKWTKPTTTTPLVATFTATTGTTYLITATLTKAAKTLRIATTKGTCKIKNGKATCSIKLKARGTWSVTITPKKNGSLGKPVKKTVKV